MMIQDIQNRSPEDPRARIAELDAEILRIAGFSNAIEYKFIKLLAEFDEMNGWVGEGVKSFAHWLNWRCGMGSLVAREKVRVARKLRKLPKIDAAFRNGELSYTKVRAMTRVATTRNEEYLIAIAKHGTARHIENAVRRFDWCKRRDAMESNEMDDYRKSPRLNWRQDEHGMYSIFACLPAEEGELVVKALTKMMDEMRRDKAENSDERKVENEKNDENVSRETPDTICVPGFNINQAHALSRIAEHYLGSDRDANTLSAGERYQVLLHVNANEAHKDHQIAQGPCCYLDEGRFLAPEVARQLACSAAVTTVVEDDEGNVLNIGRRSRTPSRAISLAVEMRDGGCRFPSCHQTKWTDQHHIVHWADGGETSEANLITLCRHHHTMLHQGKYTIEKRGNQVRFVDCHGKKIERALYPQFPDAPQPEHAIAQFDTECRREGINIDSTTTECQWLGEKMDYSMFIDSMYELEGRNTTQVCPRASQT